MLEEHTACSDVAVGNGYEILQATKELINACIDGIDDGLGGTANGGGLLNPMVVEMKKLSSCRCQTGIFFLLGQLLGRQ